MRNAICRVGIFVAALGASSGLLITNWSFAQTADANPSSQLDEIIVTAQKRFEKASNVPMSITTATGELLQKEGIVRVEDLEKIVPGLSYQPSDYGTPVYSIRGIGFKSSSVAVAPTVSVYLDQVPLPYSMMTSGAAFDVERVEVLKGPQGTLFGENSTGGAINFIPVKPTDHFVAGADLTYGRFNEADAEAFVGGPLTESLTGRLAVRTEHRDDWQESQTRDDTRGHHNFSTARMLLDWKPREGLSFELNVNGWLDKSDTQAAQFVEYSPTSPNGYMDLAPALEALKPAPNDARIANWEPGTSLRRNDHFGQAALRADWDISDSLKVTSITSYSNLGVEQPVQPDGTPYRNFAVTINGAIETLGEELRLSGEAADQRIRWMAGGNFEHDKTGDDQLGYQSSASNSGIGPDRWHTFINSNHQDIDTYAGFGSLDFLVTDALTLQASARYTKSDNHFKGCLIDSGDGLLAAAFSLLSSSPIAPGSCVTLDPATFAAVPVVKKTLDESNVSWRAGPNWKPTADSLIYANVTKGFKAGSFPTVPGLVPEQFDPIPQESVLAYEIGGKQAFLANTLQVATSGFYYDYQHKQLLGYITTAFGNLPGLVSIPKSRVVGADASVTWKPLSRLIITSGAAYIASRVTGVFLSNDPFNNPIDLRGESFPDTPKWEITNDIEYSLPIAEGVDIYIGATDLYRTQSQAAFGNSPIFRLPSYSTLDLRLGANFDAWRVELWGRNVTDRFYLDTVTHITDTVARTSGMPATFGVTIGYRFN